MKKSILAIAAVLAAVGAQADTVSFEYGNPIVQTITELPNPDPLAGNALGTLGLFDSTLGNLTGATLTVFGAAVFNFDGTSRAANSALGSLTASTDLFWSSSLGALTPFLTDSIHMQAGSGIVNFVPGVTQSFGPIAGSGNNVDDLASILGSLQAAGGGTFDINCQSLSGIATQGGGGAISTNQTTTAGCGASIVYTFDAIVPPPPGVPEPASLALVGLALAGVAGASRRRKA